MQITNIHKTLASQSGWLNTSRALTAEDFKGRIILLDFWTFCCINCMHVIPDLQYLEKKFGDDLTVIGVHSAKFANERDTENIRNAILRYNIHHPVVNDFDFSIWKKFGVRAWPTFMLINPDGTIEQTYSGEGNRAEVEEDIEKLREEYAGKFITARLPIALEQEKEQEKMTGSSDPLRFPGKLAYEPDFYGKPALFVSTSGHNAIYRFMFMGDQNLHLQGVIGSHMQGYKDGYAGEAQFNSPQGILYKDGILYIADTNNHVLRAYDFETGKVSTLAGTGKQGYDRTAHNADALKTPLASPWDLAFYPDDRHIAIAMAGTHQLWSYDIDKKTVSVLAGNGRESIDDGRYPFNSLSQPSGLAVHGGKLYFVDSETSSLRVFEDGKIKTLIGTGLFDFGYKEGKQGEALMQHPLGVYADETGVYVADSYNHSIRRYDPATGALSNFAGHGERGKDDGALAKAEFNEPNDLVKAGDKFYVADTNNHAIRMIGIDGVSTVGIDVNAVEISPEFSTDLPNVETLPPMDVAPGDVRVIIGLQKGWHINDEAPSYLASFEMKDRPRLLHSIAMTRFDKVVSLTVLDKKSRLQATLYYCEDKAGSQCLIKSFDIPLNVTANGAKEITLRLN